MASRTTDHYRAAYSYFVQFLLGNQYRSFLHSYVSHDAKKGRIASFPSIDVDDDAEETELSADVSHRQDYEDLVGPSLSDYVDILTPHMDVTKANTLVTPKKIQFAHWFRDIDEVQENASDKGDITKIGVGRIMTKRDKTILDALFASSQLRGTDDGNASAVNFPNAQKINESDGVFDIATISNIVELFETNYHMEMMEDIICVISPTAKKQLLDAGKVTNKDFVDKSDYFMTGRLPKVYGVSLMSHPLVKSYKGSYDDAFVAFTKPAVVYNTFNPLYTSLKQSPSHDDQYILNIKEMAKACRRDDKRIIQGTLGTATS